ncbi:hypothetical protein [Caproiciproducens sp. NJN-50]|nr:hypothetical protein [Caproiciproducens sp. NJN-50]
MQDRFSEELHGGEAAGGSPMVHRKTTEGGEDLSSPPSVVK